VAIASALLKGPVSSCFWLSQSAVLFLVGSAAIINLFCWAQEKQVDFLDVLSTCPGTKYGMSRSDRRFEVPHEVSM
jgi:hypothetical protein